MTITLPRAPSGRSENQITLPPAPALWVFANRSPKPISAGRSGPEAL
ncbi:hypothetical protein ACH35V_24500 [Actinomadura sp. 1N219]